MKFTVKNSIKKSAAVLLCALAVIMPLASCSELDGFLEQDSDAASQTQPPDGSGQNNNKAEKTADVGKDKLTVTFIDVGQGDSVLLQTGGQAMLIDAGENGKGDTVTDYLQSHGVKKLKYAVGTHPHSDHIGGMDTVLDKIPTSKFLCPETSYQTATWRSVLRSADATGAETEIAVPKTHYKLGKADCVVYAPQPNSVYSSANNYSVVMKVSFGKCSFLFTGDAEKPSENEMLANGYDLKADVLKIGHHGSVSSTGEKFFEKVDPDYAVICCGTGNDYGHPHRETLALLKQQKTETYRTDINGNIVMTCNGKNIKVKTDKKTYFPSDEGTDYRYIGNKNTYKFHKNDCSSVSTISRSNRVYFKDRKSAVKQGYQPCGSCNP